MRIRHRPMLLPLCLAGTLLIAPTLMEALWGHGGEDHGGGGGSGQEFDPYAPRVVSAATAKHIGLTTQEVATRPIAESIRLGGMVAAMPGRRQMVSAPVAGRVATVLKQVGDSVEAGDEIAALESPEHARNLYEVRKVEAEYQRLLLEHDRAVAAQARIAAETEAARAKLGLAERVVERARSIQGQGISAREFAVREADLAVAAAEVKQFEAATILAEKEAASLAGQADSLKLTRRALLAMHNVDLDTPVGGEMSNTLVLRAAVAGRIADVDVEIGAWVEAGREIATIADYSQVLIEAEVPESLLARIGGAVGGTARIADPAGGEAITGQVRFLAPEIDAVKRTAHLLISADNPNAQMRGGQWVDCAVVVREVKQALAIPREAIVTEGPRSYVFVLDGDGYRPIDIATGVADDQWVEVTSGLAPGDPVVVQGAWSLSQIRSSARGPVGAAAEPPAPAADGHGHSH